MTDLVVAPGTWLATTGRAPLVIGLDPSLTCTGVAGDGWADALRFKGRGHQRLGWLREEIRDRTRLADLVMIEGAAYGRGGQAGHHELAGLWWLIAQDLWERNIPYAVVNPHSRTIYATGSANPAKEHPKKAFCPADSVWIEVRMAQGLGAMPGSVDRTRLPDLPELRTAGVQFGQQRGQLRVMRVAVRGPAQPRHHDVPEFLGAGALVHPPLAQEATSGQVRRPASKVGAEQCPGQGVPGDNVVRRVSDDGTGLRQPLQHPGHVRAHPPHGADARRHARTRQAEQMAALGRREPQRAGQRVQDRADGRGPRACSSRV